MNTELNNETIDIIVIGGGASGLMLAANLDLGGARGVIAEATSHVGKKLLMSGGGRCNITHGGQMKEFIPAYGDAGAALRRCLYKHSNLELVRWFDEHGVPLADENGEEITVSSGRKGSKGASDVKAANSKYTAKAVSGVRVLDGRGRIFPASMKARDILDALVRAAEQNGWRIEKDAKVCDLERDREDWVIRLENGTKSVLGRGFESSPGSEIGGGFGSGIKSEHKRRLGSARKGVLERGIGSDGESGTGCGRGIGSALENESGREVRARNVVVASGGITYPETGSDGSMLGLLEKLGIEMSYPRPALSPVYVREYPYADLAGVSIPDVTVTIVGSDCAGRSNGVGVSAGNGVGIGAGIGSKCGRTGGLKSKPVRMSGDILFTHKGFSGPVILNISGYARPGDILRISYGKRLEELPGRMQRMLQDRSRGESGDVRTKVLAGLLDHDDFIVERIDPRGMVTAGGVALDELDLSTMRVKKHEGLYVTGEAIDAYGITGGYNLQLCWSTACSAADALQEKIRVIRTGS